MKVPRRAVSSSLADSTDGPDSVYVAATTCPLSESIWIAVS
jgi:hypothetical protein